MIDQIRHLEKAARRLETDAEERAHLLRCVAAYADRFWESMADAPAYVLRPDNGRALYDAPLTEEGIAIDEALALLHDNVDTVGANPTGRFFGFIPSAGVFHAALGDYMAAVTNRYAGHYYGGAGAVRLENMLLRWMAGVVGYPAEALGTLTSGGSLATLSAFVTARDARGITGAETDRAVVYLTEHVHHCVDRALHVAGLDACVKRRVRVDAGYRMDPVALAEAVAADTAAGLNPWLVVASAGTTNTGSVDPLEAIGEVAQAHGLWFHIDGAYGAFFALCPEGRAALHGLERSDSIILDPHKTLFLPYGTGAVLVKDGRALYASNHWEAVYTRDFPAEFDELPPAYLSPELSRHFRGLRMWLPLKVLGVAPFRAALSEKIHLARYFYEQIQQIDGFEVGPYPDLSIVTYRYVPRRGDTDAFNLRLMQVLLQEGRLFITSTRVEGRVVLRLAVGSYRTHLDEVDEALDVLARTARRLAAEGG